jgi:hypothetical protein
MDTFEKIVESSSDIIQFQYFSDVTHISTYIPPLPLRPNREPLDVDAVLDENYFLMCINLICLLGKMF